MPGPPPPSRPVRRRRLVAAAGAVVVLAGGGAAVFALTSGDDGGAGGKGPGRKAAPAAPAWAREAGRQIAALPGVRYDGTITENGRALRLALRVTRAGSASGTLTAGGLRADLVTVDGITYLKAGEPFWRTYGGETAQPGNYSGRWTKAPASLPGIDVRDVLGPAAIAKLLLRSPAETDTAGGVPAYRVKTSRADYLVSRTAPYRLLGVQTAGHGDPRFTVADVADAAPVLAEARTRAAALGGAVDPALRFSVGKLTFINCNENTNGCTVSVPATLTVPEGDVPSGARASLRGSLTSGARALGSCTASAPVPANRSMVLRCTVVGRKWRTWMQQALDSPGEHPYSGSARVVGEAVGRSEVPALLARLDKER
ncbi:hypothetical protein ACRB68_41830 [Actinomadura sp. RB68]|uniref:Lipoprotein n=1 Tax=Actinomadura macrotermitis TaxID=2585200 RepID=A0A7K0BY46_9ACTN|nr:hypothetical protein [Actinomadura macrotermitis]